MADTPETLTLTLATGDVKITIADATGKTIRTFDGPKDQGLNRAVADRGSNSLD